MSELLYYLANAIIVYALLLVLWTALRRPTSIRYAFANLFRQRRRSGLTLDGWIVVVAELDPVRLRRLPQDERATLGRALLDDVPLVRLELLTRRLVSVDEIVDVHALGRRLDLRDQPLHVAEAVQVRADLHGLAPRPHAGEEVVDRHLSRRDVTHVLHIGLLGQASLGGLTHGSRPSSLVRPWVVR